MLDVHVGGVHPDIMVLLPIVAGLVGGPGTGASMGFGAGLVADLFLPTPFGLSALVGCMIGFTVGVATLALDRTAGWLPPVAAFGASAVYEVVYAVLGSVLGQPQMIHVDLTRIVLVVSVVNAVLALPAVRLVGLGTARRVDRGRAHLDGLLGDPAMSPGRVAYPKRSGLGILAPREPLPAPSVQGLAPLPPVRARSRASGRKKTRQPKMRQSRFSVEAMLDAPDTSSARPGLRLRVTGLVVAGLFALLGLRLWALTVLQAPAAAQAVSVNQIRTVPVDPTRGLILDRYGNPLVSNQVVEQITLSRSAALAHPAVIGQLAALIGQTTHRWRPPSPTRATAPTSRCRS